MKAPQMTKDWCDFSFSSFIIKNKFEGLIESNEWWYMACFYVIFMHRKISYSSQSLKLPSIRSKICVFHLHKLLKHEMLPKIVLSCVSVYIFFHRSSSFELCAWETQKRDKRSIREIFVLGRERYEKILFCTRWIFIHLISFLVFFLSLKINLPRNTVKREKAVKEELFFALIVNVWREERKLKVHVSNN